MGRIVISENVSLDGVVEDPTGDEGFRHGGWFSEFLNGDSEAWGRVECEEALDAKALLLGRRTDEFFAARWATRTGEWADRLNSMPKYVVSSTLETPRWTNATLLRGDVPEQVANLRREIDGRIVVYGSRSLARTLMQHGLVDELRLFVFPVVIGSGKRLFGETDDTTALRLRDARTVGDGLSHLSYDVVR